MSSKEKQADFNAFSTTHMKPVHNLAKISELYVIKWCTSVTREKQQYILI